jgi:hypothetical protein
MDYKTYKKGSFVLLIGLWVLLLLIPTRVAVQDPKTIFGTLFLIYMMFDFGYHEGRRVRKGD